VWSSSFSLSTFCSAVGRSILFAAISVGLEADLNASRNLMISSLVHVVLSDREERLAKTRQDS